MKIAVTRVLSNDWSVDGSDQTTELGTLPGRQLAFETEPCFEHFQSVEAN